VSIRTTSNLYDLRWNRAWLAEGIAPQDAEQMDNAACWNLSGRQRWRWSRRDLDDVLPNTPAVHAQPPGEHRGGHRVRHLGFVDRHVGWGG
jgi:hypothetical protein